MFPEPQADEAFSQLDMFAELLREEHLKQHNPMHGVDYSLHEIKELRRNPAINNKDTK